MKSKKLLITFLVGITVFSIINTVSAFDTGQWQYFQIYSENAIEQVNQAPISDNGYIWNYLSMTQNHSKYNQPYEIQLYQPVTSKIVCMQYRLTPDFRLFIDKSNVTSIHLHNWAYWLYSGSYPQTIFGFTSFYINGTVEIRSKLLDGDELTVWKGWQLCDTYSQYQNFFTNDSVVSVTCFIYLTTGLTTAPTSQTFRIEWYIRASTNSTIIHHANEGRPAAWASAGWDYVASYFPILSSNNSFASNLQSNYANETNYVGNFPFVVSDFRCISCTAAYSTGYRVPFYISDPYENNIVKYDSSVYWPLWTWNITNVAVNNLIVGGLGDVAFNFTYSYNLIGMQAISTKFYYQNNGIGGNWGLFEWIRYTINAIWVGIQFIIAYLPMLFISYVLLAIVYGFAVFAWNYLIYWIFWAFMWVIWSIVSFFTTIYNYVLLPFGLWFVNTAFPWLMNSLLPLIIAVIITVFSFILALIVYLFTFGTGDFPTIFANINNMANIIAGQFTGMITDFFTALPVILAFILEYFLIMFFAKMKAAYCQARGYLNRKEQLEQLIQALLLPYTMMKRLLEFIKSLIPGD